MTDNEIIKALECCSYYDVCLNCPCFSFCGCTPELLESALNLINRQKAEIERLECSAKQWEETARQLYISKENIKAEAIKEFAERLKEKYSQADILCPRRIISLTRKDLDILVKEMVGDMK